MATGAYPALTESDVAADAVASATGVFKQPGGRVPGQIPIAWLVIVLLLGGGGGTAVAGSLFGREGTQALAKVEALEAKTEETSRRLADTQAQLGALELSTNRMLRDQARYLAWIVEAQQRQSKALAALAKASDIEVELVSPPLLPEIPK